MQLSQRIQQLTPSLTLAIDAKAKELQRQGADVVNLGAGEPDFDTPSSVVEAAHQAALAGKTKYTPTAGIPELRSAIAARVSKTHGIAVDAAEIVVSNGAKQALYNALQAVVNPGDDVLVFAPYWVSYPDMIALAGGRMVPVAVHEASFEPNLAALEESCTARTRGLILNSPTNPTGAVYSRETIEAIVDFARRKDLWILSDEMYELLVYDGAKHVSPSQIGAEGRARTLMASGFSKSFAMTGWRCGYLVAPKQVASAVATLQGQMTTNVNTPTQWAALAALDLDDSVMGAMVKEFGERRRLLVRGISEILRGRAPVHEPRGAFYLMQDVRPFLGKRFRDRPLRDDREIAEALLDSALVATVPGSAFAAPGFIRLSYATSRENLQKAVARMGAFLNELT